MWHWTHRSHVAATPQLRWHEWSIEDGFLTPCVCIFLQSHNLQGHVELHYSLTKMSVRNANAHLFMRILTAKRGT
jgi:hypothetical protein